MNIKWSGETCEECPFSISNLMRKEIGRTVECQLNGMIDESGKKIFCTMHSHFDGKEVHYYPGLNCPFKHGESVKVMVEKK